MATIVRQLALSACLYCGSGLIGPQLVLADDSPAVGSVEKEDEPITIRADRAWEDADGGIMHLEGHFVMRTSEWEVQAERADVQGPIEAPDRIVCYGKPASIRVTMNGENPVEGLGYSRKIVYQYKNKMLELHQNARLEMDNVTVTSEAIIYDVGNRRLISSGEDGIEFQLRPKDKAASR